MDRVEIPAGNLPIARHGSPVSVDVRRADIAHMVSISGSVSVSEVCERFGVSQVTARGDLSELARQGLVRRIRGGACAIEEAGNPSDPELRKNVNASAKRVVAQAAAAYVDDGDHLVVDAGTTALEFVKALVGKRDLSIATYDLDIAVWADAHLPDVEVTVLGGTVQKNRRYLAGPLVNDNLRRFYFDKVFLATDTFAPRQGFATRYMASATIKECMIKQSRRKFMLMDSSKIGKTSPVRFATIEDLDVIIVDQDPGGTVRLSIEALALNSVVALVETSIAGS